MSDHLAVIVLAAGLGKRMRSELPKVIMAVKDKAMIQYVVSTALSLHPEKLIVVTGNKGELVREVLTKSTPVPNRIQFAHQEQQLGTGDAVRSSLDLLKGFVGTVVILSGDTPLIRPTTLSSFLTFHDQSRATVSVLSCNLENPGNYGRLVRKQNGEVERIVEAKDASKDELAIKEINSGIYAVDSAFLAPAIKELKNENAQSEYYLTDIVGAAVKQGQHVSAQCVADALELTGANTRYELMLLGCVMNDRLVRENIENGVLITDPKTVYLDDTVEIASGAKIGPNSHILGKTKIGSGAVIEGTCFIKDCEIGDNATIKFGTRMEGATVGKSASVGPFANLRAGTKLDEEVKIGNFVETKKAHFGKGAKASHLSYVGDAIVGSEANIGAGTITCNYDGFKKYETKIGAGAFIGSNTALVAPVEVGEGAIIGAGSVITKNVEKDALGIARAPQVVRAGYAKKRRGK